MTIAYVINEIDLKIKMVKVKAHSGDRLNDRADKLAKATAFMAFRLNLLYTRLPGLKLIIACDHLIMKASSRRCIKQLHDAQHFHYHLQLYRNSDIQTLIKHRHIN